MLFVVMWASPRVTKGLGSLAIVLMGWGCSLDYAKFELTDSGSSIGAAGAGAAGTGAAGGSTTGGAGSGAAGGSGGAVGGSGGAACVNMALQFDGTDDFVEVPDHAELDAFGPMTIEAWVLPGPKCFNKEVQILSHHDHNSHEGYVLLMLNDGALQMRFQQFPINYQTGGGMGARLTPGKWSHVAGSYNGSVIRVFVDGELRSKKTIDVAEATDYDGPLRIGASSYNDIFRFQGTIDEVRLSSTGRYVQSFTPPKEPFVVDTDTVALWHFDEGQGGKTADAAGTHHGLLGPNPSTDSEDPSWVGVPCIADF